MISIVRPFSAVMTSPGLIAVPLGMFSVAGDDGEHLDRQAERGDQGVASMTAAPPPMSIFISSMPPEGLIEMPPVSKVTALPTRPSTSAARRVAGRRVAHHDHPRRLVRALGDAEQRAGAELLQARAVEHRAGEARDAVGQARACSASIVGVRWFAGVLTRSRAALTASTIALGAGEVGRPGDRRVDGEAPAGRLPPSVDLKRSKR